MFEVRQYFTFFLISATLSFTFFFPLSLLILRSTFFLTISHFSIFLYFFIYFFSLSLTFPRLTSSSRYFLFHFSIFFYSFIRFSLSFLLPHIFQLFHLFLTLIVHSHSLGNAAVSTPDAQVSPRRSVGVSKANHPIGHDKHGQGIRQTVRSLISCFPHSARPALSATTWSLRDVTPLYTTKHSWGLLRDYYKWSRCLFHSSLHPASSLSLSPSLPVSLHTCSSLG